MDRLVREGELDAFFKQIENSGGQPYEFAPIVRTPLVKRRSSS